MHIVSARIFLDQSTASLQKVIFLFAFFHSSRLIVWQGRQACLQQVFGISHEGAQRGSQGPCPCVSNMLRGEAVAMVAHKSFRRSDVILFFGKMAKARWQLQLQTGFDGDYWAGPSRKEVFSLLPLFIFC